MTTKTYTVTVDYNKSVKDLIKLGKYDWANDNITDENFPSDDKGKKELEITLIGYKKARSSEFIYKNMKKNGYRPAILKELLSLGEQHPDLQRKDWIVGLGSQWRSPFGFLYMPFLRWDGSDRGLGLDGFGGDWLPYWRFATVKVSGKLKPSVIKNASDTLTLEKFDKRLKKLEKLFGHLRTK